MELGITTIIMCMLEGCRRNGMYRGCHLAARGPRQRYDCTKLSSVNNSRHRPLAVPGTSRIEMDAEGCTEVALMVRAGIAAMLSFSSSTAHDGSRRCGKQVNGMKGII